VVKCQAESGTPSRVTCTPADPSASQRKRSGLMNNADAVSRLVPNSALHWGVPGSA